MIAGKIGDTGVIQSPHFPNPYPRDYSNEVRLQVAEDQAAIIQLIFDDFQLTSVSLIEVYQELENLLTQLITCNNLWQ